MRSCIYCGKELKDGEVCDCPQSAAHRRAKETEAKKAESGTDTSGKDYKYNPNYNSSSYQTGYTKKESKFTQAWNRFKMKRSVHKAERSGKSFFMIISEKQGRLKTKDSDVRPDGERRQSDRGRFPTRS